MFGEARWIASVIASALCAAQQLTSDARIADARLGAALAEPAEKLCEQLLALGIAPKRFFACAVPQSVRSSDDLRQLADVVVAKLLGPGRAEAATELTRGVSQLVGAFREAVPGVVDELELRSGPLRSLWEARGPGMLATLARLISTEVVAETADIILVKPISGGGGAAYPPDNAVHIEAVLTNTTEQLPEVVRLGWLWSQLHLDLPAYQDHLGRDRTLDVGKLALVIPALVAAHEVELVSNDPGLVEVALTTWGLPPTADVLRNWWSAYESSNTRWTAALAALDQLLEA